MWTHAAHGVNARSALSPTRWCVVNAYRNPGAPSAARWINDDWAEKDVPGLMVISKGTLTTSKKTMKLPRNKNEFTVDAIGEFLSASK